MSNPINDKNHYLKIAELLQSARLSVVRAVNQTMVYTYYEIGRMIVEEEQQGKERAEYGKQVLKELSERLTIDFGRGFSEDNLGRMKKFFLIYSERISATGLRKSKNAKVDHNTFQQQVTAELQTPGNESVEISSTLLRKFTLSWSHYLKLMRIQNPDERKFYEIECATNNWSLKDLQRQFDAALFERLALGRDKDGIDELAREGQILENPLDLIKDPYILEFLNLPELHQYSENELETAIIDKLENFLLELGKGFTFVGRQVRFTFDEKHFKIDLLFFNRLLKCFVVIDLKIGELSHQDIGQMQMYVNYYDRFVRLPDENKTIGIVLCKDKNDTLVEITLPEDNTSIFASRYQTILPDKQTFINLLNEGV